MSGFTVDVSDFFEFADDCERASREAPGIMQDAAMEAGFIVEGLAKANAQARHTKGTGTMANTIAASPKTVSARAATVEVVAPAVSGKGFPYPIVKDQGRGPIQMPKGRYMKFDGANGPVFLKRLPADPGSRFWSDAVDEMKRDLDDIGRDAAERIAALVKGR